VVLGIYLVNRERRSPAVERAPGRADAA
jgi:hypothetical protein